MCNVYYDDSNQLDRMGRATNKKNIYCYDSEWSRGKKKMYSLTPNRSHYYYNRLKEMQVSLIKQTEYTLIFLIVSQMHQLISIKHAVNIYLVTI